MTRSLVVKLVVVVLVAAGGVTYLISRHEHSVHLAAAERNVTKPKTSQSTTTPPAAPTPAPAPASSSSGNTATNGSSSSVSVSTKSTSTVNGQTAVAPTNIEFTATDDSATQLTFGVARGSAVTLTIHVSSSGVYHNGLIFKSTSPALNSGVIAPGATGTLYFTAGSSFQLQPYWADGTPKGYSIAINVS